MHDVIVTVDGRTVAQNGIEVTQSFEMTPDVRPGRDDDRTAGQGARLADDGEHLGGELGQQLDRMGLGCRDQGVCGGEVSRCGACRRSCDQGLHRLPGAAVPELRAVAGRAPSPSAVHVPHDAWPSVDSNRGRRAVSAPAGSGDARSPSRMPRWRFRRRRVPLGPARGCRRAACPAARGSISSGRRPSAIA